MVASIEIRVEIPATADAHRSRMRIVRWSRREQGWHLQRHS